MNTLEARRGVARHGAARHSEAGQGKARLGFNGKPKDGRMKLLTAIAALSISTTALAQSAHDPGVRGGPAAAGSPLSGLTSTETTFFNNGLAQFQEQQVPSNGLGPRFNLDSCAGCHAQPAIGGTSPITNPQIGIASAAGARNSVPAFLQLHGPAREARFKRNPDGSPDGGVHDLFVISGRSDAPGCSITQDAFNVQFAKGNVSLRIPTPLFGAGLIEAIPDNVILANIAANNSAKRAMGILGRANRVSGEANTSGNTGTVTRFGWKAQNPSLSVFSGEAYNVEMGISNEAFPNERETNAACQFDTVPNDVTKVDGPSDAELFALFMRFLAPPTPSLTTPGGAPSIFKGRQIFSSVGCAMCHTPTLQTIAKDTSGAISNKPVDLFSDLALHGMGDKLADGISQGAATGNEFRTAPLWGLGQRIFFLHDGRTSDLVQTILAHSSENSEANQVIRNYLGLPDSSKQDLLNFLRSL